MGAESGCSPKIFRQKTRHAATASTPKAASHSCAP